MQYAIRAVRFAQVGVAGFYFLGEQLSAALGRSPPKILGQMHENKFLVAGAVYGLDVVAQTFKSINAFEVTYNGRVLHSKLSSGRFPAAGEVVARLRAVMQEQGQRDEAGEAEPAAVA